MTDPYTSLISTDDLAANLDDPAWRVVDTRFDLTATERGRELYLAAHVPGAVYAHLDEDLSGPPLTDRGRHPLPAPEALEATFARLGLGNDCQVVAYDQADGITAGRLWWLLRYMGHRRVAVLDGGFDAWSRAGQALESGPREPRGAVFTGSARREWVVVADEVARAPLLVDARDGARYRGEHEPIDPRAGHIPGAVSHFYRTNVDADGRFLPPETLASQFAETLGDVPSSEAVFYCGSGVSACQNLLALECAGLAPGKLYAGSWSEWSADPARPAATGAQPNL